MTAPTGCHTCGGGGGRHDEAAHTDWPAEVDHRRYWNEVLGADYCVGDGEPWPCLAHRQATPPRCTCGRPVPASSSCGCCCAECDEPRSIPARFDERYDPSPEPIERRIS